MPTINKDLDKLLDNTYLYRGREVTVMSHIIQHGEVIVKVKDGHPIVFPATKINEHIKEFMPISDENTWLNPPAKPSNKDAELVISTFKTSGETFSTLETTLLENIEKVKLDKGYIPQAKEINSQVSTLVKINKQKIEMAKEIRKFTR